VTDAEAPPPPSYGAAGRFLRRQYRWWNQLRVLAAALIALGAVGAWQLGVGAVLAQLLLLPAVAATTELVVAGVHWHRLRFPWSGLVTGLFVALLLPPQGLVGWSSGGVLLFAGAALAAFALLIKHLVRTQGRPWFNPTALAMVAAGFLFGITPAWWGAVSLGAMVVAGLVVNARAYRRWPLPLAFFATYSALVLVHRVVLLHLTDPHLLLLSVVDPAVLFFTLFMVTEPRSSPNDPLFLPVYGAVAGVVAVTTGFLLPSSGTLVSSESLLLGLLAANLVAVGLRALTPTERAAPAVGPRRRPRPVPAAARRTPGWGWGERVAVGFAALLLLGVTVSIVPPPPASSSGPPPKVVVVSCSQDNKSLAPSTLQMLHNRLGPSVIFNYDSATGATVFYDPVNHVTVYETDLFEDYGSAEFNGDDGILAQGCSTTAGGG
jgi:NQR2, RnfD, RnfE family